MELYPAGAAMTTNKPASGHFLGPRIQPCGRPWQRGILCWSQDSKLPVSNLSILHQPSDKFIILHIAVVIFQTSEDLIDFLICQLLTHKCEQMPQFSRVQVSDQIPIEDLHTLNVILKSHGFAGSFHSLKHWHESVETDPLLSGWVNSFHCFL